MRPQKLNKDGATCVVTVDVDVFWRKREVESVLDNVFIELVVEE